MAQKILDKSCRKEIVNLFTSVFTASEDEEEGKLIGDLVSRLSARIDNQEIIGVGSFDGEVLIGAIFFTRLDVDEPVSVYMLSPVAISTGHQGKGVGQALIGDGLDELRNRGVSVVVTYGDPAFYSRSGFQPLSTSTIPAPLELSMPEGWLGQSLTGEPVPVIGHRSVCVEAFSNPDYW